jgi:nucleoside-diphosphate-sugar epimerase
VASGGGYEVVRVDNLRTGKPWEYDLQTQGRMRVLLADGAGFIGWHAAEAPPRARPRSGHSRRPLQRQTPELPPWGVPLRDGYPLRVRGGLRGLRTQGAFAPGRPMDARRSVREPHFSRRSRQNVLATIGLPKRCAEHGVGRVVSAYTDSPTGAERGRTCVLHRNRLKIPRPATESANTP